MRLTEAKCSRAWPLVSWRTGLALHTKSGGLSRVDIVDLSTVPWSLSYVRLCGQNVFHLEWIRSSGERIQTGSHDQGRPPATHGLLSLSILSHGTRSRMKCMHLSRHSKLDFSFTISSPPDTPTTTNHPKPSAPSIHGLYYGEGCDSDYTSRELLPPCISYFL